MDITTLVAAVEGRLDEDAFPVVLSMPQWQLLAKALARRELRPGDSLLRRNQDEELALIVERGQLQVTLIGRDQGARDSAVFHAGTVVGEASLLGKPARIEQAEAMAPCVVWGLTAVRLQALAAESPALVAEVLRAASAVWVLRSRRVRRGGRLP